MNPVAASTRRIRFASASAIRRVPAASTARPIGQERSACVAGPPSASTPSAAPATVEIVPVASMRRTLPASQSET
jgi:hypothetical protein